jgi:hypothetical protein
VISWPAVLVLVLAASLVAREAVLEVQAWRVRRNAMRRPEPSNVVELRPKARREA